MELLDLAAVARRLRASEADVRRLLWAGTLPAVDTADGLRVRRDDVESLLAHRTVAALPWPP